MKTTFSSKELIGKERYMQKEDLQREKNVERLE